MVEGDGIGWRRRKKGKLIRCWYNDLGAERSKVIGDASVSDAEGMLIVADLKLNKKVGQPDPRNATLGMYALTGLTTEKPKQPKKKTTPPSRPTGTMGKPTYPIGP